MGNVNAMRMSNKIQNCGFWKLGSAAVCNKIYKFADWRERERKKLWDWCEHGFGIEDVSRRGGERERDWVKDGDTVKRVEKCAYASLIHFLCPFHNGLFFLFLFSIIIRKFLASSNYSL